MSEGSNCGEDESAKSKSLFEAHVRLNGALFRALPLLLLPLNLLQGVRL